MKVICFNFDFSRIMGIIKMNENKRKYRNKREKKKCRDILFGLIKIKKKMRVFFVFFFFFFFFWW